MGIKNSGYAGKCASAPIVHSTFVRKFRLVIPGMSSFQK